MNKNPNDPKLLDHEADGAFLRSLRAVSHMGGEQKNFALADRHVVADLEHVGPAAGADILWALLQDQALHQVLGKVFALCLLEGSHACRVPSGAILLIPERRCLGLRESFNGFSVERNVVSVDVDGWIILFLCLK